MFSRSLNIVFWLIACACAYSQAEGSAEPNPQQIFQVSQDKLNQGNYTNQDHARVTQTLAQLRGQLESLRQSGTSKNPLSDGPPIEDDVESAAKIAQNFGDNLAKNLSVPEKVTEFSVKLAMVQADLDRLSASSQIAGVPGRQGQINQISAKLHAPNFDQGTVAVASGREQGNPGVSNRRVVGASQAANTARLPASQQTSARLPHSANGRLNSSLIVPPVPELRNYSPSTQTPVWAGTGNLLHDSEKYLHDSFTLAHDQDEQRLAQLQAERMSSCASGVGYCVASAPGFYSYYLANAIINGIEGTAADLSHPDVQERQKAAIALTPYAAKEDGRLAIESAAQMRAQGYSWESIERTGLFAGITIMDLPGLNLLKQLVRGALKKQVEEAAARTAVDKGATSAAGDAERTAAEAGRPDTDQIERNPSTSHEPGPAIANVDKSVEQLRSSHGGVLDTRSFPFDNDALRKGYDAVFVDPAHPPQPGARIKIDLPVQPAKPSDVNVVHLDPRARDMVNQWAISVLQTAQKAFPGEKLNITNVSVGRGWNAGNSYIHIDNQGTYLHATCTTNGESTVVFKSGAMDKLRANKNAKYSYITGKDKSGNLSVTQLGEVQGNGREKLGVITIPPSDYIQPPTGQTIMLTGLEREQSIDEAVSTLHSSPLFDERNPGDDRLTLFVSIAHVE